MYGNNFGNPFMMPNMAVPYQQMVSPNIARPMMRSAGNIMGRSAAGSLGRTANANGGLRSLLGLGARGGLTRGINWSSLLGNASRALGVVNQAIPIVKEVGPMMHNMKSMLKIASVFKDETDANTNIRNENNTTVKKDNTNININDNEDPTTQKQIIKNSENNPNFFL
ncbi:MAG: VrrA/YqfQ family protein [Bacilli bacterium]